MKYIIIGLGIYGSNLAINLADMGHEVVGVDSSESRVEAIKEYISTAYILDSSDEQALSVLPLKSVDAVVVAIGENFGASIKTVAILKKFNVKHIFARAIDTLHQAILEGLNVERILKPEQQAANELSKELELGAQIETLGINHESYVMKFVVPNYFVGTSYSQLDMAKKFKLILVVATRPTPTTNIIGVRYNADEIIDITDDKEEVKDNDRFTCYGTVADFKKMMKTVSL